MFRRRLGSQARFASGFLLTRMPSCIPELSAGTAFSGRFSFVGTVVVGNSRRDPPRRPYEFLSVTGARERAPRSKKGGNGSGLVFHEICGCRSEYGRRG